MGKEFFSIPEERIDDLVRVFVLGLNACAGGVHEDTTFNVRRWALNHNPGLVDHLDKQIARAKKAAAKSKRDRIIEQSKRRGKKA